MGDYSNIGITGWGYSLPAKIRTNDDPIFNWLKENDPAGTDLFKGYKYRRVLDKKEDLSDIMSPAGQKALDMAGVGNKQVDLLLGFGSTSEYTTPNILSKVHKTLDLGTNCQVMPVNNEFTNFQATVELATGMVKSGIIDNALVVIGCNWTRYVSYYTAQSVSASDGAAAVVISNDNSLSKFSYVDSQAIVESEYYGEMFMSGDQAESNSLFPYQDAQRVFSYTHPYFHITDAGREAYSSFGIYKPIEAANELLRKNNVESSQVTMMSHQSSTVLIDKWQEGIKPGQYINTIEEYANMTLATIPVTFASKYDEIANDYVLLLGVGVDFQTVATLLKRN